MKTLLALFLACFTATLFAQPQPPILRNSFTTNYFPILFAPNQISNLVVWLDPLRATNAVDTTALRIPQGYGLYNATNLVAGERPTLRGTNMNGRPCWEFDGGDDLTIEGLNCGSLNTNITVFIVSKATFGGGQYLFSTEGINAGGAGMYIATSQDQYNWVGGGVSLAASGMTDYRVPRLDAMTFNNAIFRCGENGFIVADTSLANLGLTNSVHVGSLIGGAGLRFTGYIADVLIYNRKLTPEEFINVVYYLRAKNVFPELNLVFIGDSITAGTGSANGSNYPAQVLQRVTGANKQYTVSNVGISGHIGAALQAYIYTNDALPLRRGDVAVLDIGSNDATIFTSNAVMLTVSNCAQVLGGAGATVIVNSILQRGSLSGPNITNSNILIGQNWRKFADKFLYSLTFDTGITNGTADGIHPASQGYAILASYVAPAVMGIPWVQTVLMPTNNGSGSNFNMVLNPSTAPVIEMYLTNNITMTNFYGMNDGEVGEYNVRFYPQLISAGTPGRGLGFPAFGVATLGTFIRTNGPIWGVVTNNTLLRIQVQGTNQYWTMNEWK